MTFTYLFYKHIMFRHSCGVCHFTNLQRPSDITLADFWGWEEAVPGFNDDDKGVSLVLCNTEKGRRLFDLITPKMNVVRVPLEKCIQPNLKHPSEINVNRMDFEKDYAKHGICHVMNKYGYIGWRYNLNLIKSLLKRKFRNIIYSWKK